MRLREEGREELRRKLLDVAERHIEKHGLCALNAKDVTAEAGVAAHAIESAFQSLDLLIVHVNARTLGRLLADMYSGAPFESSHTEWIVALAQGYLRFALENRRLWAALFDYRPPEGTEMPRCYREELARFMIMIASPMSSLRRDLSAEELQLRAHTLFAAVHGVVQLSLTGQFVDPPVKRLEGEVVALVRAILAQL